MKALRAALAAIACVTVAASCFLTQSYLTLKGTSNLRPVVGLIPFVAQSALALVALGGLVSAPWFSWLLVASGAGIGWVGWSTIQSTLSGPHFEGYALVMGLIGIIQGVLTLVAFFRLQDGRTAGLLN